jgi:hypothetical protein
VVVCLASHDPEAVANYKSLMRSKPSGSLGDLKKLYIHVVRGSLVPVKANENPLEELPLNEKSTNSVEFIAHGHPILDNELLSRQNGPYDPNDSNPLAHIKPETIYEFFKQHATENKHYKFTHLILYCCNSLEFGTSLHRLMPEINLTCYKDYISIHADGIPYPYKPEKPPLEHKPLDEFGNVITEDAAGNKSAPHLPAKSTFFPAQKLQASSERKINESKPDDDHSTFSTARPGQSSVFRSRQIGGGSDIFDSLRSFSSPTTSTQETNLSISESQSTDKSSSSFKPR